MNNATPEQQAFITEVRTTRNSIRLDAVAGSGKTTTLVSAASGIGVGERAIALAFNKSIAEELQKRFPPHVQCKTLNGIGHQVWMKAHGKKILDAKKTGDLVSKWCEKNVTKEERELLWVQLRTIVSACKSGGFVPKQWLTRLHQPAQELTEEVFESLCEANEIQPSSICAEGVFQILMTGISEAFTTRIDFDDQIYMSTYFAEQSAWPQFDVVLVDEAQDLSRVQHDMVERLGARSRLIVVGDAHQAIYGWRGASCHSLNELEARFGLKKMPLTVSFRCPEAVIKEAKRLVPHIQHHKTGGIVQTWPVSISDEEGEVTPGWFIDDFVANSVVLCRNNAPLIRLGFALVANGKPVFFANRDVGAGLKKIVESLSADLPFLPALQDWHENESLRLRSKEKFYQLDILDDKYEALLAIAEGSGGKSKSEIIRGIEKLFLSNPSPHAIELSTIHRSKGKEWHTVYLLKPDLIPGKWLRLMQENGTPGADDLIQQEWNLKYVAITRALDTLVYVGMEKDQELYANRAAWLETLAEGEKE